MAPTEINSLFIKAASAALAHCTTAAAEHGVKVGEARELPFADSIAERHRLISVGVKHASWMDSLKDKAVAGAGWVKDKVMDPETYKDPAVLAGLGAAAVGGIGTMMTDRRPGEGFGGKTMRVGRNALLAGLLGGGSAAALRYGMGNIDNALPKNDKSPVTSLLESKALKNTTAGMGALWGTKGSLLRPAAVEAARREANTSKLVATLKGHIPDAHGQVYGGADAAQSAGVSPQAALRARLEDAYQHKGREFVKKEMPNFAQRALGHNETRGLLKNLRDAGINYGKTDFGPLKDWAAKFKPSNLFNSTMSAAMGAPSAGGPSLRDALGAATERARVAARIGVGRLSKGKFGKGLAGGVAGYFAPDILNAFMD